MSSRIKEGKKVYSPDDATKPMWKWWCWGGREKGRGAAATAWELALKKWWQSFCTPSSFSFLFFGGFLLPEFPVRRFLCARRSGWDCLHLRAVSYLRREQSRPSLNNLVGGVPSPSPLLLFSPSLLSLRACLSTSLLPIFNKELSLYPKKISRFWPRSGQLLYGIYISTAAIISWKPTIAQIILYRRLA